MKKELEVANLKRECKALEEKYENLSAYLEKACAEETEEVYCDLLMNQLSAMRLYLKCIEDRIDYMEFLDSCKEEKKPEDKEVDKGKKDNNDEGSGDSGSQNLFAMLDSLIKVINEEKENQDKEHKEKKRDNQMFNNSKFTVTYLY